MAVSFLSGLNRHIYGPFIIDIHNLFMIGWNRYPKTLTNAYDLAINWKGDTGSVTNAPIDGMEFVNDNIGKGGNVHATDISVKLTRSRGPVECHICGLNHYTKNGPNREYCKAHVKKKD